MIFPDVPLRNCALMRVPPIISPTAQSRRKFKLMCTGKFASTLQKEHIRVPQQVVALESVIWIRPFVFTSFGCKFYFSILAIKLA